MSAAPQQTVAATLLDTLHWRTAQRDDRMVAKLLDVAELDRTTELRAQLEAMLCERVSECRDLFALRGVRPQRPTVLQMAGRSLARDREQIARINQLTPGMGPALLRAISQLIEAWAGSGKLALA
ncbi:MAG TPA: hypothetical protein VFW13_12255 [Phenylobacterium sp.]|nr:hypothetical protein [Phenylobacterium sp.]